MSEYRDDTVETATVADQIWGGFKGGAVEEYGRMAAALFITIGVLHTEQAVAVDAVLDRHVGMIVEQAAARDEAPGAKHVAQLIQETAAIKDGLSGRVRAVLTETGIVTDYISVSALDLVAESAAAADFTSGVLHASGTTLETGRLRDVLVRHAAELVIESAGASESITERLRARSLMVEAAGIHDEAPSAHASFVHIVDTATLSDETTGLLRAASLIEEVATIDAAVVTAGVAGQAWVSEADNWAMSRYDPFGFEAAAVIGGVVYLAGPDGLFALDADDETIVATLLTGKVDAGPRLSKPLYAYLEYTLDGAASVEVRQTQDGLQEQAWGYPLERGSAMVLTNARVPFGRGLRGRHFTYALNLEAKRGYINDMTVLIEPGSRRI